MLFYLGEKSDNPARFAGILQFQAIYFFSFNSTTDFPKRKKLPTLYATTSIPLFLIQCNDLWWSVSIFFCIPNRKEESQIT